MAVPADRITPLNERPPNPGGEFVLYWMTANRRASWNFALDRAVELAAEHGRPLLVLEALRADYPWASDRLHRFVLDGMRANRAAFAGSEARYVPYVEPRAGEGKGLVDALAARSVAVVTDDFPCFFLPRMASTVGARSPVLFEKVDANGLLPTRLAGKAHPTAYVFRRMLQKALPAHLDGRPRADPFAGVTLPKLAALPDVFKRMAPATEAMLDGNTLDALPIDHTVGPVAFRGGTDAARAELQRFLAQRLLRYADDRNHPDHDASSNLSPWLHFGHLSAHEVFDALADWEDWLPEKLGARAAGQREGFWNMGASADAFLDQLVTWRELGYATCVFDPNYATFESVPNWARATLAKHAEDRREWTYSLDQLEAAATHDAVWNAGQRELVETGRMHNYLRMLWGKKVLEWSRSPEAAFDVLVHLNNKYAVDGRNPNSYSGILWTFGKYDRPWAPERPIFGSVRFMSSANTVKKLRIKRYLERWGAATSSAT